MADPQFSDYLKNNPLCLLPGLFIAITGVLTRMPVLPLWVVSLGAAWITGGLLGQATPLGFIWPTLMALLIYCCINKFERTFLKWSLRVVGILGFLVLSAFTMLHLLPGIHNPVAIDHQLISDDGILFTMNINLDKSTMGLLLMGILLRPIPICEVKNALVKALPGIVVTPLVLIAFSWSVGFVTWDPKTNDVAWLFCLNNLFLVCVGEEGLFRGFIQGGIQKGLKLAFEKYFSTEKYLEWASKLCALLIASLLFGVAHFKGGWLYMILSFLAGVGYGSVYMKYRGKFCQCDDFSCDRHRGELCSGPNQGWCDCGVCKCKDGFEGDACQCPTSDRDCIKEGDTEPCSGNGACECGKCKCSENKHGLFHGNYCEEPPTIFGRCTDIKPCVQCKVFESGPLSEEECRNQSICYYLITEEPEVEAKDGEERCTFTDDDDCQFTFVYGLEEPNITVTDDPEKVLRVRVENTKECPLAINILAIVAGVIVAIVALGLAILCVWKVFTTIHDRREYAKFEKEKMMAKWDTGENPIYKQATSTFKNPTYGGKG